MQALFPIGTLVKSCGVTRRMLLNYEEHGLLPPVFVAPNSGYRYYDASSVTRVCRIVELQRAGFSLLEISRSFSGDRSVVSRHLERLKAAQRTLAGQIAAAEAYLADTNGLPPYLSAFPAFDAVCVRRAFDGGQDPDALAHLSVLAVLRSGWQLSELIRQRLLVFHPAGDTAPAQISSLCAVRAPNPESVHFPAVPVLCMHCKTSYAALPDACEALRLSAPDFHVRPAGDVRIALLPAPEAPAARSGPLILQLFLPVADAAGAEPSGKKFLQTL